MNHFEEFYGETVLYSEIEQISYIDLKDMVFEKINKNIKFRKFGRNNNILTIKMDIKPNEYKKFLSILKGNTIDKKATNDIKTNPNKEIKYNTFNFLHNFTISNIRYLTNEDRVKFNKTTIDEDEDEGFIEYFSNINYDDIEDFDIYD